MRDPFRSRPVVLLIDDAIEHLNLYELLLEDAYAVVRATRGATGYEVACIEQPDVILLDLLMPDMDGWTVCRLLKANAQTRHIPVLILTALESDDASRRAQSVGAAAVLRKSSGVDAVIDAVDALSSLSRPRTSGRAILPAS